MLITSLPSPEIVKLVYNDILKDGKLPSLERERLFIDSSTVDPPTSRALALAFHTAQSGTFVDAPISGGVVGARAGTLSFMFGAPNSTQLIEQIKDILSLMGTSIWRMGSQGAGSCSKLANNYIVSINNIATAEALNMAHRWGLDLKTLTEVIKSSTGRCWPVESNNPVPGIDENSPASNNYEPGGTVNMVKKDLGLAIAGAEASGAPLLLASKAYEIYQTVSETDGSKDLSIVYQWLQDQSSK